MSVALSLLGTLIGVGAVVAATYAKPTLRILYNVSDSAPRGSYAVVSADHSEVDDCVVARLPADIATQAAKRGYVPSSVPVLKRIAAISGQFVCIRDGAVYVDRVTVARRFNADRNDRPLIAWTQCRRLVKDEFYLLNALVPASFDSRYFGPVDGSFVCGRAIPLASMPSQ